MTNILMILCHGKYKLPCLNIILHAGIIGLIVFLKPGPEPGLRASSCRKHSPSSIQACRWAGLGQAQMGWALGFGPSISLIMGRATNTKIAIIPPDNETKRGNDEAIECPY
jgi:hypothetical protein